MRRYFLLITVLGVVYAHSQDGSFDPAFAQKGWIAFNFMNEGNSYYENAVQVLPQTDGKYIVVLEADGNTVLTRRFADGKRDSSFAISGYSTLLPFTPTTAVQTGDKIIVSGSIWDSYTRKMGIIRFNIDGTLDMDFGENGLAFVTLGTYSSFANAIAIQPDGKILVAGPAELSFENISLAMIRWNPDGSPDATFGTNGIVTGDFGGDLNVSSMVLQRDGNIVVGGYVYSSTTADMALWRYTASGQPDNTFGTSGLVTTDLGGDEGATSIAIQKINNKERFVVAGYRISESSEPMFSAVLVRYLLDGTLDNSFGTNGWLTDNFESDAMASSVVIQRIGNSDRILIGGAVLNSATSNADFLLARYTTAGTSDNTFGTAGVVKTDFEGVDISATLLVQTDGKILIAGTTGNESVWDLALVRYTASGAADNSFGTTATGTLADYYPVPLPGFAYGIALQPDGKILTASATDFPEPGTGILHYYFNVARFNSNGTLDQTFGTNGIATISFEGTQASRLGMAIQSDGKIVVASAGIKGAASPGFVLTRFTATGQPDLNFGTDGISSTTVTPTFTFTGVAIQRVSDEEKIVAVGYAETGFENNDIFIARYNSDGSPDASFGTSGLVISDLGMDDYANGIAIQNAGGEDKLLIVGRYSGSTSYDFLLARYNTNGTLDNSFGTNGIVNTDISGFADEAVAVALAADGKIIVSGKSIDQISQDRFAAARYEANGTPDNSFNAAATATIPMPGMALAMTMAVQPDGKVVVGGFTQDGSYLNIKLALERYNTDGTPDASFGTGGLSLLGVGYPAGLASLVWYNEKLYGAGLLQSVTGVNSGLLASFNASSSKPAEISITDFTVFESPNGTLNNTAVLRVSLNKPLSSPIAISYATEDGTALSKGKTPDYKSAKGTVNIAKGATTATIAITVYKDNIEETDESFTVNLAINQQVAKLATISKGTGVVTIKDGTGLLVLNGKLGGEDILHPQSVLRVKVFPNPASGVFNITCAGGTGEAVTLIVTDAAGRIVEKRTGVSADSNIQIGDNYRPGVYYLQLSQGSEKVVLKLLKQPE